MLRQFARPTIAQGQPTTTTLKKDRNYQGYAKRMADMGLRWVRSRSRSALTATVVTAAMIFFLLPYDNPFWLAIRFNATRLSNYLDRSSMGQSWLESLPEFPVHIPHDVGVVIKTGYGTQHRLPAVLKALETGLGSLDIVVIADYTPGDEIKFYYGRHEVKVHDVLGTVLQDESLKWMGSTPRFEKYMKMTTAIAEGNSKIAKEISKSAGWELDAAKFIPGLKLAYDLMPHKKWYLLIDDDTYPIRTSIGLLLKHLNPDIPQYIGNPVGDFKTRFAHGGSSVLLSQPTLRKLFTHNPHVVSAACAKAITETWGDKLLAATLMKIGIYLDERFGRFFNGERPLDTRIWSDRFCLPVVAFHSLADPQRMREVGETFAGIDDPVLWSDLWKMYHGPDLGDIVERPIRDHEDHVGRRDESTVTITNVKSANGCLMVCRKRSSCLAWTWDGRERSCTISPWMIVGQETQEASSGVIAPRALKLLNCRH